MQRTGQRSPIAVVVISIVGLAALSIFSCNRNSVLTLFGGFLLLIFFAAVLLQSLVRAIREKDLKRHLAVIGAGLVGIFATLGLMRHVDQDLRELNQERRQVFKELRPVFLAFKAENGIYPATLDDLVPRYVERIPAVLLNDKGAVPGTRITYRGNVQDAVFQYHTTRGPDASEFYSMAHDRFEHQN